MKEKEGGIKYKEKQEDQPPDSMEGARLKGHESWVPALALHRQIT